MAATTRFLADAHEAASLFSHLAAGAKEIWIGTAWASDRSSVSEALWKARHRLAALVVGLDFHQTDPQFLRRFRAYARVQESADGTFHPKLYVFRTRGRFNAIVGSSNMTRGGFGQNVEANVHIAGEATDEVFVRLTGFIEELALSGRQMLERDLEHYEKEWRRRRPDVRRATTLKPSPKTRGERGQISMHVAWPAFVAGMLKAAERKGHDVYGSCSYLSVITEVQRLFRRHHRLCRMSDEERRRVAGLVDPYGYFGRMTGAGLFQHYVNEEPELLDRALDNIPVRPAIVTRAQFNGFTRTITRTKGLGRPGVGSRLLAMKRPDVFLCLDSANRVGLGRSFGLPPARLYTYDGYWELMELLWRCPWYRAPRPKGRHRPIWEARVALVDAFFYEPQ